MQILVWRVCVLSAVWLLFLIPLPALESGLQERCLSSEGRDRSYHLYYPKMREALPPTLPLLFLFHGGGGNSMGALKDGAWMALADSAGFIIVAPNGTRKDPTQASKFLGNGQSWNDGSQRMRLEGVKQQSDDIAFVRDILEEVAALTPINHKKVYASGFSNGAAMTFRVARELSDVFAAVAPVAGHDFHLSHQPQRAIPLLYITGTEDPLNPYAGGEIFIGPISYGIKGPVPEMMQRWRKMYACAAAAETIYAQDGDRGYRYRNQASGAVIEFYVLFKHGHHWPGQRSVLPQALAGANVSTLDAHTVIWSFFSRHQLP